MRQVHEEMLIPPERLRSDEAKLNRWNPPVKREIDWDGVLHAHGKKVGSVVGGATIPKGKGKEENKDDTQESEQQSSDKEGQSEWQEPEFLTVGLIGNRPLCSHIFENLTAHQVNQTLESHPFLMRYSEPIKFERHGPPVR
jgi:hypothetical protein